MTLERLANLERIRQLKRETPSATEFSGLVRSGSIRLKDSANEALDLESRFDLAYNAAHALALAALRWHGYRSESRYLVFQCLGHTLGIEHATWRVLDAAHAKRNVAEYQGELDVDEAMVAAMIRATREIENLVRRLGPVSS